MYHKNETAVGMGAAVVFVLTLATLVTYLVYYGILAPLHLEYLQTIAFILVIASLVQMVEIIIKKFLNHYTKLSASICL